MTLKKISKNPLFEDFIKMLFFGALSYIFGLVKIQIPELETTTSDFREIPLLISIFYISNPVFFLFMSALSLLSGLGYFYVSALSHAFSLIISYFVYNFLKKQNIHNFTFGILWLFYIFIYFAAFLLPFSYLFNYIFDVNLNYSFFVFYKLAISSLYFEILSTAIITSLFLVQFNIQNEIKNHKRNLEILVRERTDELHTTNEEVKATNEELFAKNDIINAQNAELKATLENLKETQAQLFQAEKMASLGVLTAGVAHEINNPLNYILGSYIALENYFKETNNNDETIKILLSSLKTGVDRATNIVKALGQFSKSGNSFNEKCDIHSIINYCLLLLQNKLNENFEVKKEYYHKDIFVLGNIGKLHQVFINIITNSIQAIENEGSIYIKTNADNKNISIEIKDSGCGISQDNLSKIADPFFTTKEVGEGTGLGLSIAYNIIKEHKGSINFVSEINKGTSVTITLPKL